MKRRNRNLRKCCACASTRWGECAHAWHVNLQVAGRLYRFSLDKHLGKHPKGRREAEAELSTIREKIKQGTFRLGQVAFVSEEGETGAGLSFRQVSDKWLADPGRHGGARLVALNDHRYRLAQVCAFVVPGTNPPRTFGACKIAELTASDIEAYRLIRKATGVSVVTRNHDIKLLRQVWNWAMRHRLVDHTPFRYEHLVEIPLEPEPGRHMRFDHEDDEQRLLAAASPHLRDVIIALLETTCRPGEILSLQWADVNLLQREIIIRAEKAKTRVDRLMPVSQRLLSVLEMRRLDPAGQELPADAYVFGDALGRPVRSVRRDWEAARKKAGLARWHLADLRHESASRYEQAGVPVSTVSKLLGHTSLTTTTTYLNTLRRELHRAVQTREATVGKKASDWQSGDTPTPPDAPPRSDPKLLN
jgi:integrase